MGEPHQMSPVPGHRSSLPSSSSSFFLLPLSWGHYSHTEQLLWNHGSQGTPCLLFPNVLLPVMDSPISFLSPSENPSFSELNRIIYRRTAYAIFHLTTFHVRVCVCVFHTVYRIQTIINIFLNAVLRIFSREPDEPLLSLLVMVEKYAWHSF